MLPTNRDLSQFSSDRELILARLDARYHRSFLGKIRRRFFALAQSPRKWLGSRWESPLAYAIRSELRGILPRIRLRLEIARNPIVFGPGVEQDANGCLVLNRRTQYRILDTQAVTAIHPWSEEVELWFFLQGWEAGARWAESNRDSDS
jgi:hypothetical protein